VNFLQALGHLRDPKPDLGRILMAEFGSVFVIHPP
jgi:hypothetical protein